MNPKRRGGEGRDRDVNPEERGGEGRDRDVNPEERGGKGEKECCISPGSFGHVSLI